MHCGAVPVPLLLDPAMVVSARLLQTWHRLDGAQECNPGAPSPRYLANRLHLQLIIQYCKAVTTTMVVTSGSFSSFPQPHSLLLLPWPKALFCNALCV